MPPWLRRDLVGARDVFLGDDEHVHRRLGCDVVERVGPLTLGDGLRRDLPGDDFAKQAITHVVLSSLPEISRY